MTYIIPPDTARNVPTAQLDATKGSNGQCFVRQRVCVQPTSWSRTCREPPDDAYAYATGNATHEAVPSARNLANVTEVVKGQPLQVLARATFNIRSLGDSISIHAP